MQRFGGVAPAAAVFALHPHVGQEVHLHATLPKPLTGLAPATRHIEGERPLGEAAGSRFRHLREELADVVEHARVGGRRRARRRADRLLIHEDYLVDLVEALDGVELARLLAGRMQPPGERSPEYLQHERGFSTAARAGHRREHTQRKPDVDPLERAVTDAPEIEPAARLASAVLGLPREHRVAGPPRCEIRPRHALLDGRQFCGSGVGHDPAALAATARTKVEGVVGRGHHVAVVLDHHDRVAKVAEFSEGRDQPMRVTRVEADRRLVEHVKHARETAAYLGRESDPLEFAAGKAAGRPRHVEILKAHIHEKRHAGIEFAEQITGDLSVGGVELHCGEFLLEPTKRHPAPDVERASPERDGAGDVGQSAAAALAARHLVHHGVYFAAKGDHEPGRLLASVFEAFELEGEPGSDRTPGLTALGFRGGARGNQGCVRDRLPGLTALGFRGGARGNQVRVRDGSPGLTAPGFLG